MATGFGTLNAVAFAMRATVHTTKSCHSFSISVRSRCNPYNIGFEADWQYLKDRRQRMIRHNNECENARRVPHTYNVGNSVKVEHLNIANMGHPKQIQGALHHGSCQYQRHTPSGSTQRCWCGLRNVEHQEPTSIQGLIPL
jgi:hypothetical protein